MKITQLRTKYNDYKISYIPKIDYVIGITDTKLKKRRKDLYKEVFILSKKRKYWILYTNTEHMTGYFNSKKEAVKWFKDGGR
jgi:uncharacterized protein YlbG (UPF0298 family)